MKNLANKHRHDIEFNLRDQAFIKLQLYRFHSLASHPNEKLNPRFYDSYEMIDKISQVAYKIKLLDTIRIRLIFHVSQLKKRLEPTIHSQQLPECLSNKGELRVNSKKVLGYRYSL